MLTPTFDETVHVASHVNKTPLDAGNLLMQKRPGHRVPPAVGAVEEGVEVG